ncbi:MAG: hypothetical protein MUF36_05045 [Bacteroidales bacterium]|jgi:hypothetical protein|nr:hypothetical protein [Bacteroidales bacterium]
MTGRYKMKTKAFLMVIFSIILIKGNSQNRIKDWDIDKITQIQIENRTAHNKTETIRFSERGTMDFVFSYLKQIDFKAIDNPGFDKSEVLNQWIYKITFQGQHDQVLLCQDYAAIGKTIFSIDNKVITDFGTILATCKRGKYK